MAQKWGLWTALSCGDCFGLFGAFGSCFHPYRRHHSGLKGFYIFCSQRKCTLCLKWEEEDQRHHGGKLCRKLMWIIDVGVKFCEELKRAAAVSCWGVFLRFVRLFCVCVCVVVDGFVVARVLVCVYIKITWCHYCTMLCLNLRFLPELRQ